MNLQDKTIKFILNDVHRFYFKAIQNGVSVSAVTAKACNLYTLNLGNAELTYLGTADGTAKLVGVAGDIN